MDDSNVVRKGIVLLVKFSDSGLNVHYLTEYAYISINVLITAADIRQSVIVIQMSN